MTDDLGAILEYVDALRALDTAAVEPMTHAVPFDCPTAGRRGEAVAAGRRGAGERPAAGGELLPGSPDRSRSRGRRRGRGRVVIDARGATAVAIARRRAGGQVARARRRRAVPRSDRAPRRRARLLPAGRRRRGARGAPTRSTPPARPGRDPGALAGVPLGLKDIFCTRGIETTCASKILRGFVPPYESTVTARLAAAGGVDAGQAEHGRVRDGLVEREQLVQAGAQPVVARRTCRAARRAARRRRSRRRCARARSAPTPAARSGSRPRSAAWSASSRPTAASRATASSRSRRRSISWGRSGAPSRTRRRCSR